MKPEEIFKNKIFSVSEFNEFLNSVLQPMIVTVEGEISDWRVSQGKFIWFNIKDENETLQCFSLVYKIHQPVEEGMKVKITGYPRIYGKSGRFSFFVEKLELSGEGSLKRAFEILRLKLEKEGLFDENRKRALPRLPETIGLITSQEAAAYSDFVKHLKSRLGGLRVIFTPVAVQGEQAVGQIVAAFDYFNEMKEKPNVLVLIRGGGSLEDLKEFNSEEVTRAVFSSKIPVVVGIGHERDTCLAELACDMRVSTPTHAAQIIVPSLDELLGEVESEILKQQNITDQRLHQKIISVQNQTTALRDIIQSKIYEIKFSLQKFLTILENLHDKVKMKKNQLGSLKHLLISLSPDSVLSRGYSIVRKSGRIIKDVKLLNIGDMVEVKLKKGLFQSQVKKTYEH